MKKLDFIRRRAEKHWVGDGFPVRTIFSYEDDAEALSPFLLLDYAGPTRFEPTAAKRGVGEHPHRGFETVTIVYDGEVEHRDSSGGGGTIGPGDVQWMTAAGGLVHEEFHSARYGREGGPFETIQLWVNLPSRDKLAAPGYQTILRAQIPRVALPEAAGSLRVIAGSYGGQSGPARTFSPLNVWDLSLAADRSAGFKLPSGHTTSLFVRRGRVRLPTGETIGEAELAVLQRDGEEFAVEALDAAEMLILNGQPLGEPVVGYGPFVMNTPDEIRTAVRDFQTGRLGTLPPK